MRSSVSSGLRILSLALLSGLLVCSGCGNNNPGKPRITDEELIQESINAWLELLDLGNESGLEELYDPVSWQSSPTKSEYAKFTGRKPTASDVSISVSGNTASAAFIATTNEEEQTHVAWTLHKVPDGWKITSEEWS